MKLPGLPIEDLLEGLRDLADISFAGCFPHIPKEDIVESDAADFIETVVKFLQELVDAGGPLGERAARILSREETVETKHKSREI